MSCYILYNQSVKEIGKMFEKLFGSFFVKTAKKSGYTVISARREIKQSGEINKISPAKKYSDDFWDNRGKVYGALFTSLNGRVF